MKISEMSTDKALDVICDITPHVKAISTDSKIQQQLKDLAELSKVLKDGTKTAAQIVTDCLDGLCNLVPVMFADHRADIYAILACVNQTTIEAVSAQNLVDTLGQIKEIIQDEELRRLFT